MIFLFGLRRPVPGLSKSLITFFHDAPASVAKQLASLSLKVYSPCFVRPKREISNLYTVGVYLSDCIVLCRFQCFTAITSELGNGSINSRSNKHCISSAVAWQYLATLVELSIKPSSSAFMHRWKYNPCADNGMSKNDVDVITSRLNDLFLAIISAPLFIIRI